MSNPQTSASPALSIGATIADERYQLTTLLRTNAFGPLYDAIDAITGDAVSIQVLDATIAGDVSAASLKRAADAAKQITHKNITQTLDSGIENGNTYWVCEEQTGQTLSEILTRRSTDGSTFSLKQASNIAAQLCLAVEACSKIGGHGAVCLETILLDTSGRIQLTGLGLGIFAPRLAASLGARLSPETHSGDAPSSESDVYGVGATVYELLVGTPPAKGCTRPSEAGLGLTPLVDQFVGATTNPDKSQRPVVGQLAPAVQRALSTPSMAQARQSSSVVAALPKRPSLAQSIANPKAGTAKHTGSHSATLSRALAETRERWLFSSGKLDYGPFSMAAIVEQIETGKIIPGNILIDNDTGQRVKVEDHPLLADLVDTAQQKRDDERRANAEVVHAKQEKSRGAALYVVVGAGILGIAIAAFFVVKGMGSDSKSSASSISSLEEGSIEAKISFPTADEVTKKRRRHGGGGKNSSGGTSGGWDNSLSFDMAGKDVGSETLSNGQVTPVLQRFGGKYGRCLNSTGTSDAFIEFMIKGTGKVYQVRVNGSTKSPVARCLRKVMMSMKFPAFDGIRSQHTFDISL